MQQAMNRLIAVGRNEKFDRGTGNPLADLRVTVSENELAASLGDGSITQPKTI